MTRKGILGLAGELDQAVFDLAFYGWLNRDAHPAASGDVSQIMSEKTSAALVTKLRRSASRWFPMKRLETLVEIRNDGRTDYRSEGIKDSRFYRLARHMAGRVMMITTTASQIPAIHEMIRRGISGRLLNLVEVDRSGRAIRILYGNREYGTIPSIETHFHILANAVSIKEGEAAPATVHAHPFCLIALAKEPAVRGDFAKYNAALYSPAEGLNRNEPRLVGVIPYVPSGTARLVAASIKGVQRHRLILWRDHGFVVRSRSVERGYAILAYAERNARMAIEMLRHNLRPLPRKQIEPFLDEHGLLRAYRKLGLACTAK